MNRFEIRDILNAHKEHFRVLPTNAMNDVFGIIQTIDNELEAKETREELGTNYIANENIPEPGGEIGPILKSNQVEKPSVVGSRAKKTAKKSKRPKR